jgi:probable phosphoglycerate mutase
VIAEACRQVTGSQAFAFLYAENGSITRLVRMPSERWALISFNDTAHLEHDHGK